MKKIFVAVIALVLLFLCACGGYKSEPVYYVTVNGKVCTVDTENQTITCEDQVCQYSISGGKVTITYPDGARYFSTVSSGGVGSVTASGWSEDYPKGIRVLPGGDLVDALMDGRPKQGRSGGGYGFVGLITIALGIWNVASPHTAWYLSYGWRYKDAEPSEAALMFERIGGIIAIIAGIVLFFV